ncbi:carboxylate-amine ligase [Actinokineospora iranica]|uniref:Putative glutamate--cysteine ligase 2 n=1 Tax=Actinokineospora iranica TaxID=1271860 RepID=A0A1G6RX51_9PSEU|nr:glutamate--cysteine ligase [Actinokineospora iranica]SDD08525.1 carboxylate-amine ligase [Actinokineospora iranica]
MRNKENQLATQGLTVGVEEEFLLVDDKGGLVYQGPEAIADHEKGADLKTEMMRCQVESATGICRGAKEIRDELAGLREQLARGAQEQGATLIACGTATHGQPDISTIGPGTRYHRIARHVGKFIFGGVTCGCHVHVGVEDRSTALAVANHLRPWLPTLLALCANSAFHEGEDTGYASVRHLLWGRWPSAGPPPYMDSPDQYEEIVQGLLATGAAMDRKMVYWDVRPSEAQPTVEIRVSDVAGTVEEATLLAVLVRCLVADALAAPEPAPRVPTEIIRAAQWRAAREGLAGEVPDPASGALRPVRSIVGDLVRDHAAELRATGELEFVESTLNWLNHNGDGAHRQREAYARTGGLDGVLRLLAEQTSLSQTVPG